MTDAGRDQMPQALRAGTSSAKPRRWLTPKCPSGGGQAQRMTDGGGLRKLEDQVKLWPTPNVPNGGRTMSPEDIENSGATDKGKRQVGLENVAKLFATPAARDWKSGGASVETMSRNSRPLNEQASHLPRPDQATGANGRKSPSTSGLRLNPAFDCWLIDWPWWWTNPAMISFAAVEMESFLSRQRSHLASSLERRGYGS